MDIASVSLTSPAHNRFHEVFANVAAHDCVAPCWPLVFSTGAKVSIFAITAQNKKFQKVIILFQSECRHLHYGGKCRYMANGTFLANISTA